MALKHLTGNIKLQNFKTMNTSLKNTIKFGLFTFIMMLLLNVSYAQRGKRGQAGTPEERAEKTAQRLTKKLGLNADQTTQVKASALKFENASQTARTNRDRSARKAARQTFQNEIKGILTTEQYQKYEQMKKQRKGRKGRHG